MLNGLVPWHTTWVVEMRIWCIKIIDVIVIHYNPWVEASAGGLLVPEVCTAQSLNTSVLALNTEMNWTVKKKVNFVNSSQNEGSSPWGITLSFDGFGSISCHSVWFSSDGSFSFHFFSPDFQRFRTEHHWRDLISRNANLVHQNC
jgi:hypothetical protein